MAPPHSGTKTSTPSTDPPFVITLRVRDQPAARARLITGKSPVDALKRALNAKNVAADALMTWRPGREHLVALDIDPAPEARLPADYDVGILFPAHLPRPAAAWRTHGGGVRAIFVATELRLRDGEVIAEVSALEAAAGWLFLAPLAGLGRSVVELKADSRHPHSTRPEGGMCGPVTWFGQQPCVISVRGSGTAADVSASAIAEWCAAEGVRFGRYATSECPIPACTLTRKTSGNPPIEVNDVGMHCHRCKRHVAWSALLLGRGRHQLSDAAEHFVHFEHQIHVLRAMRPGVADDHLFRAAWRLTLLAVHGHALVAERGAEVEDEDEDDGPRVAKRVALAAASGVNMLVRAVGGSWLQAGTLAARTTMTARTVRGLPWVQRAEQIDEALDTVALAGFTPIHVINAQALLPPYFSPPDGAIVARRRASGLIQTPVNVARPPSEGEVARARRVLDRRFPGINHAYLDSLIVAGLHAQHARGQPPFIVVTGRTGAAKTATIEIAAAALGTSTASVKLDESRVTGRDIGLALEHGAGFILIDEIGRARDPFQRLDAVLKLGERIRFDAKFRNEVERPMNAAIVLAGSSIPHALSRSPEMARRALGLRLVNKAPGWHREHLSRVRDDEELREALDAITAQLWHALAAEGPRGHWRDLCLRLGASEMSDLELDDVSAVARAAILRTTFEYWRTAPSIAFYRGSGHDRDWLDLANAEQVRTALEEIVDLGENANAAIQWGQFEDLRKVDLAPILGFETPVLELVMRRRSARLLVKFVQRGVQKGKEIRRVDLPAAPLHDGRVAHPTPLIRVRESLTPYATTPGAVTDTSPPTAATVAAPPVREIAVAFDIERIAPGVERPTGAALVTNLGEAAWRPGAPLPEEIVAAATDDVIVIVRDWMGAARRAWVAAGWPLPRKLLDLSRLERATGNRIGSIRAAARAGGAALAEARAVHGAPRSWTHHASERAVLDADRAINERGYPIDRDFARGLHDVAAIVQADLATIAGVPIAVLQKPAAFLRVLARAGGPTLPDMQRATLEQALEDERLPHRAARLIEARIGVATSTISRARSALHHVDADGRVRDTLVYFGAHPGRWSARGYPAHNQPRVGKRATDVTAAVLARDVPALVEIAKAEDCSISALLTGAVRNMIIASDGKELVVADYASFEPRVLRWMIGDDAGLAQYREPEPYRSRAVVMFGRADTSSVTDEDRELAKLSEIACPYGMGGARLETYGRARGLDWNAMPMDAAALVDLWRGQNPQVLLLWHMIEVALDAAARGAGHQQRLGRLTLTVRQGEKTLAIRLPVGRSLRYADVQRRERDGRTEFEADARGRRVVYGGAITQNITEAVTRDLLASVLVRAEAAKLSIILHVHDEVVLEGDEDAERALIEIMTTPPAWAPGLPLAVKTARRKRYGT